MLIKANAHRRDTEHAAVGVFALRLLVLFCVNGRGLEIVSAELCVVGVEDRLIPSGLRQRQAVALPQHRAEIAHGDELFALAADAAEGDDGIVAVVAREPAEAVPVGVVFPEAAVVQIEMVERAHEMLHLPVLFVVQQHPVEPLRVVPLDELRKFVAHEIELLARMRDLVGKKRAEVVEFIVVIARHFADQRTFAVHDLVVAEREDEILGIGVGHGERQRVMVALAPQRVEGHIFEHVVHPTHVPLEEEAETAVIVGSGD